MCKSHGMLPLIKDTHSVMVSIISKFTAGTNHIQRPQILIQELRWLSSTVGLLEVINLRVKSSYPRELLESTWCKYSEVIRRKAAQHHSWCKSLMVHWNTIPAKLFRKTVMTDGSKSTSSTMLTKERFNFILMESQLLALLITVMMAMLSSVELTHQFIPQRKWL